MPLLPIALLNPSGSAPLCQEWIKHGSHICCRLLSGTEGNRGEPDPIRTEKRTVQLVKAHRHEESEKYSELSQQIMGRC